MGENNNNRPPAPGDNKLGENNIAGNIGDDTGTGDWPLDKRLVEVNLDQNSIARGLPEVEHERLVAVYDLVQSHNTFYPIGKAAGPYSLTLSLQDNRLVFDVAIATTGKRLAMYLLSLSPFRKIVKDYFLVCESYYEAIKYSSLPQIETIDMARRAIHDEASQILMARLNGKIAVDVATARRLFTLVCALHWKG